MGLPFFNLLFLGWKFSGKKFRGFVFVVICSLGNLKMKIIILFLEIGRGGLVKGIEIQTYATETFPQGHLRHEPFS